MVANAQQAAIQQDIAQVIGQQLGGIRKLGMMVGAKNFVALDANKDRMGGLKFMIGAGAKNKARHVMIELAHDDTYDVTFAKIVKHEWKPIAEYCNVFCDMLMDVFEQDTGFYLTFSARG